MPYSYLNLSQNLNSKKTVLNTKITLTNLSFVLPQTGLIQI